MTIMDNPLGLHEANGHHKCTCGCIRSSHHTVTRKCGACDKCPRFTLVLVNGHYPDCPAATDENGHCGFDDCDGMLPDISDVPTLGDDSDLVHVVIPRPGATPDQLRQLADAMELVEEYLASSVIEGTKVHYSFTAHIIHEMFWTWGLGKYASWNTFDVERFHKCLVEASDDPKSLDLTTKCACHFFQWLGGAGNRIAPVTAEDLQRRITMCHHRHQTRW